MISQPEIGDTNSLIILYSGCFLGGVTLYEISAGQNWRGQRGQSFAEFGESIYTLVRGVVPSTIPFV